MAIATTSKAASTAPAPSTNRGAMAMVTTLFFMWAFLTELNDILIPHLQSIFDLNYTQSMLVQLVFFTGYALFAIPAGKFVEWAGYKRTDSHFEGDVSSSARAVQRSWCDGRPSRCHLLESSERHSTDRHASLHKST